MHLKLLAFLPFAIKFVNILSHVFSASDSSIMYEGVGVTIVVVGLCRAETGLGGSSYFPEQYESLSITSRFCVHSVILVLNMSQRLILITGQTRYNVSE